MDIQAASGTGTFTQTLRNDKKHNTTLRTKCSVSLMTGGMPIKTRNRIPSVRMTTLRSPQTINGGEGQEEREPPYTTGGKGHWQQPLEKTVFTCQKKKLSRELCLGSDIPTPGPGILIKPSFKMTHTPQRSLKHYLQKPRQTPDQNAH